MNWLEIRVDTTSEGIEALSDKLIAVGLDDFATDDEQEFESFLENNRKYWDYVDEELREKMRGVSRVTIYVSDDDQRDDVFALLRQSLAELREARPDIDFGSLNVNCSVTDDADWGTAWMKYYKPFKVGRRLYVKPEWETLEDAEGRVVYVSNPGLAFGSGTHETTRLCMQALEDTIRGGETVLDMGCGSGILSVISALLGASAVVGADIDDKAADVSKENAARNGVSDRTSFYACDLTVDDSAVRRDDLYDVVVINIVADVIIMLLPKAREFLKPGGTLILSGIIDFRLDDVMDAVKANGITVKRVDKDDNWYSVIASL